MRLLRRIRLACLSSHAPVRGMQRKELSPPPGTRQPAMMVRHHHSHARRSGFANFPRRHGPPWNGTHGGWRDSPHLILRAPAGCRLIRWKRFFNAPCQRPTGQRQTNRRTLPCWNPISGIPVREFPSGKPEWNLRGTFQIVDRAAGMSGSPRRPNEGKRSGMLAARSHEPS